MMYVLLKQLQGFWQIVSLAEEHTCVFVSQVSLALT